MLDERKQRKQKAQRYTRQYKFFHLALLNMEISVRDHRCNAGTVSYLCRKLRGYPCCASRDISICFPSLSVIFTMVRELSGEQFRITILYDWKSNLYHRKSDA